MNTNHHVPKKSASLLVYLENSPQRSLREMIYSLQRDRKLQILEGRGDVFLFSDNVLLFDETTAHGIFVQLCSCLDEIGLPYLIVRIDLDHVKALGRFSKEAEAILKVYEIPLITS